jgi:hypothetical protein
MSTLSQNDPWSAAAGLPQRCDTVAMQLPCCCSVDRYIYGSTNRHTTITYICRRNNRFRWPKRSGGSGWKDFWIRWCMDKQFHVLLTVSWWWDNGIATRVPWVSCVLVFAWTMLMFLCSCFTCLKLAEACGEAERYESAFPWFPVSTCLFLVFDLSLLVRPAPGAGTR